MFALQFSEAPVATGSARKSASPPYSTISRWSAQAP